jgi:hypothetical protein
MATTHLPTLIVLAAAATAAFSCTERAAPTLIWPTARPAPPVSADGFSAKDELELKFGEEFDLPSILGPVYRAGDVRELDWSVSNPDVVALNPSNGRVKGLARGRAVITVRLRSNPTNPAQVRVSVVGSGATVKVAPDVVQLVVGEAVDLQSFVTLPDGQINGNVTWASSDATIAHVNVSGRVSALQTGRVTVVATYALDTAVRGLAELQIYNARSEFPPLPTPAPIDTRVTSPQPAVWPEIVGSEYVVRTLAGGSTISSADGKGPAAGFNRPTGIAVDKWGFTYVADSGNHRIRKVAPDGQVTTVAGSVDGYSNRPGNKAKFYSPYAIAVTSNGTLYVADSNFEIRKIAPDGEISVFAPRMRGTSALALDSNDTLYAAINDTIVKFAPDGKPHVLAGSEEGFADGTGAAARFAWPASLACDRLGNIYVADRSNNRIRKVTPDGVVTTLAGDSRWGHADGPAAQARFGAPTGVAVDERGDVFVVDSDNNLIRRIAPSGVSTIAGRTPVRLDDLTPVSPDGPQDGPGPLAVFRAPQDIAMGPDGALHVSEQGTHAIRKLERSAVRR